MAGLGANESDKGRARKPIDVAAGLVFRNRRLLITQRRPNDHLGGLWEFPGGKRETNESFEACLERELMEELGIVVAVRELIDRVTHDYPERSVSIRFYRCEWLAREPTAIGCADFKWVGPNEMADCSFPAADSQMLSVLQKSPQLWEGTAGTA